MAAYAPEWMQELEAVAFMEGPEMDAPLTEQDWAYLTALERLLDIYPEMRMTEEE